eukprot:167443_1
MALLIYMLYLIQCPALSVTPSPIVGTIDCGETKQNRYLTSAADYWQLTITSTRDITYSTCNSQYDTSLTIYNRNGVVISGTECSLNMFDVGDDCGNVYNCDDQEIFTMTEQPADTYYARVSYYRGDEQFGQAYDLSVTCANIQPSPTTSTPTTTPTTSNPTTSDPTTSSPTTSLPTTSNPTTTAPTTNSPTTYQPTTSLPTTRPSEISITD